MTVRQILVMTGDMGRIRDMSLIMEYDESLGFACIVKRSAAFSTFGTLSTRHDPMRHRLRIIHRGQNRRERPVWLSFLTCYHFGYHLEHHRYPWVLWWRCLHYVGR